MTRTLASLFILAPFACAAQFDVASIHPTPPHQLHDPSGIQTRHGRLNGHNVTLKRCVIGAYAVSPHQIAGGPDWFDTDRFEILAGVAEETTGGDMAMMTLLKILLADRFKLAFHRETRMMPTYVLRLAKGGPKLEKSTGGGEATSHSTRGRIDASNISMAGFAEQLGRQLDRPVVDRTELAGAFNLKMEWARDDSQTAQLPSIFSAIQQLGLRLTAEKTPVEMLVIDHAERPTEN